MSLFQKIVVPVDGSEPSDAAVHLAIRLARDQEATLLFVHVCEVAKIAAMVSAPVVGVDASYAIDAEREAGEDALRRAAAAAVAGAVHSETILEDGGNVDSIVAIARRQAADLIVIGTHGRGGIARAMLGSVAEGVLRHSDIPVLVTRCRTQ
jgi:nucleotide-binding universal stress UspA family protein